MTGNQEVVDCPETVTQTACDARHRGITRWLSTLIILMVVVCGTAGSAFLVARDAAQDTAVQSAAQEEVNKRVLESLDRIETDVRILRNGHGHE